MQYLKSIYKAHLLN